MEEKHFSALIEQIESLELSLPVLTGIEHKLDRLIKLAEQQNTLLDLIVKNSNKK